VLQVPTPGLSLKICIIYTKIFNSLLLLNTPPFPSTISFAIFLFGFSISILYKITKIFKFYNLITFNSFLAILFIFTHLLFKSFAFCCCVVTYCKSKRMSFSSTQCMDILPFTLLPQPLSFHIPRLNHATLLPSFIMQQDMYSSFLYQFFTSQ